MCLWVCTRESGIAAERLVDVTCSGIHFTWISSGIITVSTTLVVGLEVSSELSGSLELSSLSSPD